MFKSNQNYAKILQKVSKNTQNIIYRFLPAINFCQQIAGKAQV